MSALGNKGEKNQSKFKAIDINNLFKGSSVTPQKSAPGECSTVLWAIGIKRAYFHNGIHSEQSIVC